MFARFGRLTLSVLLTQRMSAMRVAAAAWQHHFDGPVWAVRVIRHQGLIVKDAAPCTFLHEGRVADILRKRKISCYQQRKLTFRRSSKPIPFRTAAKQQRALSS
jgi:hypothetical protein